ncbi:hypothetical protein INT45_006919 [Circinella minor]|uniref:Uncharacterized protein n=1 Tax=Circinella minor TaxID=1195481 RepID=A0A8H7VKM2_9FUNG|nr:hypothetical protein INT45_006919 [Circinella minor]
MFQFIQLSQPYRKILPEDHTLFLTYLNSGDKTPSSISIKYQDKRESSLDRRSKQHANWSHKANTFEKYYYKPIAQQSSSTQITNSILLLTKNHTTLTDGAGSMEIVVGTTNNCFR